jgi:hypothetical protein
VNTGPVLPSEPQKACETPIVDDSGRPALPVEMEDN